MKVYVLGDSISIHYGPYLKQYLNQTFEYSRKSGEQEALYDLDKPTGANGGDSSMVVDFLTSLHSSNSLQSDLLLVNAGLHDIKTEISTGKKQTPITQYKHNINEIIRLSKQLKTQLIWINSTHCEDARHNKENTQFYRFNDDVIRYNHVSCLLMRHANIPIIDLNYLTQQLGDQVFCDHIHFCEEVRQQQAAFIAGYINAYCNLHLIKQ